MIHKHLCLKCPVVLEAEAVNFGPLCESGDDHSFRLCRSCAEAELEEAADRAARVLTARAAAPLLPAYQLA